MSNMEHYNFLAEYWDKIYTEVPYQKAFEFIDSLRKKHKLEKTILDVACGTGTLLSHFEKNGYSTFGNDLSPKMIDKAQQKLAKTPLSCGSYFNIQTNRKFPLIISFFNSFAYCINTSELFSLLIKMRDMLEPNGLLIFDLFLKPEVDFKCRGILDTSGKRINRIFYGAPTSKGIYKSQILYTILEPNKPVKNIIHKTERGIFTLEQINHTFGKITDLMPVLIKDNLFFDTTTFITQKQEK